MVKAWDDVLSALKGKLLSVPTKAAPVVAAEIEAGSCQRILEDLINEALEELSNYEPSIDPTEASVSESPEETDSGTQATTQTKRKRVGRPKKTAGLANK